MKERGKNEPFQLGCQYFPAIDPALRIIGKKVGFALGD
jgi:hypothetical protein